MENLRVEWQPEMITFADGTALNLNGEQPYSIENNIPKNQTGTAELPTSETNSQTMKETTTADTKPKVQKSVQKKRPQPGDLAENETTDADELKDARVFDNFETLPKKKTKVPSPTPIVTGEKNQMMIKMPDGRIRLVNQ